MTEKLTDNYVAGEELKAGRFVVINKKGLLLHADCRSENFSYVLGVNQVSASKGAITPIVLFGKAHIQIDDLPDVFREEAVDGRPLYLGEEGRASLTPPFLNNRIFVTLGVTLTRYQMHFVPNFNTREL